MSERERQRERDRERQTDRERDRQREAAELHIMLQTRKVMLRIKAGLSPVEADGRARLLFTSGFYSNQVFLCVSTLKPGLCADSIS